MNLSALVTDREAAAPPPTSAATPRVERRPDGAVYLVLAGTDTTGATCWRVHDGGFGPPHAAPHRRRTWSPGTPPPGMPPATGRWFVAADGTVRLARLPDGASRALDPALLAHQLHSAEYLGRGDAHRPPDDPRSGRG